MQASRAVRRYQKRGGQWLQPEDVEDLEHDVYVALRVEATTADTAAFRAGRKLLNRGFTHIPSGDDDYTPPDISVYESVATGAHDDGDSLRRYDPERRDDSVEVPDLNQLLPDEQLDRKQALELLTRELDVGDFQLLMQHHKEELAQHVIAAQLGKSRTTVTRTLGKAAERAKSILEAGGWQSGDFPNSPTVDKSPYTRRQWSKECLQRYPRMKRRSDDDWSYKPERPDPERPYRGLAPKPPRIGGPY